MRFVHGVDHAKRGLGVIDSYGYAMFLQRVVVVKNIEKNVQWTTLFDHPQYEDNWGSHQLRGGPRRKKKTGKLILQLGALLFRSMHTLWPRTWHTMLMMTGLGATPPTHSC